MPLVTNTQNSTTPNISSPEFLIDAGRRAAFHEVQEELDRRIAECKAKGWMTHVECLLETSIALYKLQNGEQE